MLPNDIVLNKYKLETELATFNQIHVYKAIGAENVPVLVKLCMNPD